MGRLTTRDKHEPNIFLVKDRGFDIYYTPEDKGYEAISKLNYFEDLEEQGRLKKFPCDIGDTLWVAFDDDMEIEPHILSGVSFFKRFDRLEFENGSSFSLWDKKWDYYFGERIFLTKEEAERKLAELEGE